MFFDDEEEEYGAEDDRLVKSTKGEYDIEETCSVPKRLTGMSDRARLKKI